MRRAILVFGMAVIAAGCSSSLDPKQACLEATTAACQRLAACNLLGGATEAQCEASINANNDCNNLTTANVCGAGQSFNSSSAQQCIDGFKNESCTDLGNSVTPPSCMTLCQ